MQRHQFRKLLAAVTVCGLVASASAAKPVSLIELQAGSERYQGRVLSRDSRNVLLLDRAGKIVQLPLSQVTSFRTVASRFTPLTPTMLNTALLRELGSRYEVKTTRHYVVAAPRGRARKYVDLFEEIYRAFHMHFSVRGFEVERPEFPLVAIVFPDHAAFARYARSDDVNAGPGLMGYYMPTTNRIALFEGSSVRDSSGRTSLPGLRSSSRQRPFERWVWPGNRNDRSGRKLPDPQLPVPSLSRASGMIRASLRDTMIHEATHQVAFNVGLHSRTRANPQWVVEGLATCFEPQGMRDSSVGRHVTDRINRERFIWFRNYARERRKDKSLPDFVASDDLFQKATLDAYAEAWALSFFLIETRPRKYATYLKQLAAGDSRDRSKLFSEVMGTGMRMLEAEMLRFFKRLE